MSKGIDGILSLKGNNVNWKRDSQWQIIGGVVCLHRNVCVYVFSHLIGCRSCSGEMYKITALGWWISEAKRTGTWTTAQSRSGKEETRAQSSVTNKEGRNKSQCWGLGGETAIKGREVRADMCLLRYL